MAKCKKCLDNKYLVEYSSTKRETTVIPCPECNQEAIQAAETIVNKIRKPEPDFDIIALPVDKAELRLIKIALFEISEYLNSPKLAELRQRVNSLMSTGKVKIPADSIFNDPVFTRSGN